MREDAPQIALKKNKSLFHKGSEFVALDLSFASL